MEEGKGERYLAPGRQYGNALLGVRHQEEEEAKNIYLVECYMCLDILIQFTAITWLKEFVILSGPVMLSFVSGILSAILPCLAYDDDVRISILVHKVKGRV